jgi:2-dehydro-3-deoxy-L-rhamnonate dehydrogenase (NAD+)
MSSTVGAENGAEPRRTRRRVLVTGGSNGLGLRVVERLVANGDHVVVLDRQPCDTADWLAVDLSDPAGAEATAREAVQRLGGLDALVLSAGVNLPGAFATQPLADWIRVLQVNLIGNVAVTHAVTDDLVDAGGRLVGVGSTASRRITPEMSAYGVSKHAFTAFMHAFALEYNGVIGVSTVHPGMMDTNFFAGRQARHTPPVEHRMNPNDVATAVLFCLDQPASIAVRDLYITDLAVRDWP